MGPRAGLDGCEKSRPTGIRSPDCPARSQWVYRLSYAGSREGMYSLNMYRLFGKKKKPATSMLVILKTEAEDKKR